MSNSSKARKAVAAARLAASAAARYDDGDGEATAAAGTAGRLAFEAGMPLAEVSAAVPELMQPYAAGAWSALVDAWYDAQDASRPSEAAMQAACQAVGGEHGEVVASMMQEILAFRARHG